MCDQQSGQVLKAEATRRLTLQLMQQMLGVEHSSTLASMNNLAYVLEGRGKYVEAEAIRNRYNVQ
jgi:hypothetical protein